MTDAERKAAERQRKRDAGLVPVEVWCRPEDKERIKEFARFCNLCSDAQEVYLAKRRGPLN